MVNELVIFTQTFFNESHQWENGILDIIKDFRTEAPGHLIPLGIIVPFQLSRYLQDLR